MASKNLGAVIQRAISDGAFRRQLQSDPAAALRGFNLTPDEVAAIRSGDSGKLMSLGVDQRMSKAFILGGGGVNAKSTTADLSTGGASNALVTDQTSGAREGIVGDPTSGSRQAMDPAGTGATANTLTAGDTSSTAAGLADPTVSGTRAVFDSAPFGTPGTSAVEDPNSPEHARLSDAMSGTSSAAASGATGDPYSGQYLGVTPDFQASVASQMADSAARPINDVAPFEGNVSAAAAGGTEGITGDARLEPGLDSSHTDANVNPTTDTDGDAHPWG